MPAASRVWIGLSDLDQEMYYSWTDGSEVTFTNWAYYEPNNSGEEDCVEMWMSSVSVYKQAKDTEPNGQSAIIKPQIPSFTRDTSRFSN